MKVAVIFVGSHYAGKSKTINQYLKPRLGLKKTRQHRFRLAKRTGFLLSQSREEATYRFGYIRSQSLEEAKRRVMIAALLRLYAQYDLLVLVARPSNEQPSYLNALKVGLRKASYKVRVVTVKRGEPDSFYKDRAKTALQYLRG